MGELLAAGEAVFNEMKNVCVWNKTNGGMGTFYRSKHEMVFVFKVGAGPQTVCVRAARTRRRQRGKAPSWVERRQARTARPPR